MPQLNPAPWFTTFLISWAILLILLTPKLSSNAMPHPPQPNTDSLTTMPWTWPWS
nr:ATPase subunit 8 [Lucasium damaeum]